MKEDAGIIYAIGDGRYGLAKYSDQKEAFLKIKKVFLHVYTDASCTIPEINPSSGKPHTTLKDVGKLIQIGYSD